MQLSSVFPKAACGLKIKPSAIMSTEKTADPFIPSDYPLLEIF
jgi:hypothetical protein